MSKGKNKKKRSVGFSTTTVYKFARLAALIAPAGYAVVSTDDNQERLRRGVRFYTGFDMKNGNFYGNSLVKGWMPFLMTSLITKGISKLNGIIRRL